MYQDNEHKRKDPSAFIMLFFVLLLGGFGYVIYKLICPPAPNSKDIAIKPSLPPSPTSTAVASPPTPTPDTIKTINLTTVKEKLKAEIRNQENTAQNVKCIADLISIQSRIKSENNLEKAKECFCQEGDDCSFVVDYKKAFQCQNRKYGVQLGALETPEQAKEELKRLSTKHGIDIDNLTIVRNETNDQYQYLVVNKAKSMKDAIDKRKQLKVNGIKEIQMENINGVLKYQKAIKDDELIMAKHRQ